MCANTVLEIGAATGRDAILDVLHRLDEAVLQATQANIGAKYARKIRKRLQALLDEDMRSENVEAIGRSEKGSREVDESNLGEGWKRVCGSGANWTNISVIRKPQYQSASFKMELSIASTISCGMFPNE